MKPASPRILVYFLLALMVFALACAAGSSSTTRTQQTYENPPMQGGQFMELHGSLQAEADDDVRMERLKAETAGHYFLTSQVRSLLGLFETTEERLESLAVLRGQILDMDNSYSVVTSFPPEDREAAHAILEVVHEERRAEAEAERQREEAERERRRAERRASAQGLMEGMAGTAGDSGDVSETRRESSVPLPPPGAMAMTHSAFSNLRRQVDDAHMSRDKIGVISTASASNYFTASQVAELVGMVDMASDRVTVVETTVHRILDLENSHVILDALTFGSERSDVEAILQPVAQERERERARLAEEERRREEARRAEQERQRAQRSDSSQSQSSGGGSGSYRCCLGGRYNECDNAAAAGSCVSYGMCIFGCMMGGDASCEDDCLAENPLIRQCRAVPSNDHLCDD